MRGPFAELAFIVVLVSSVASPEHYDSPYTGDNAGVRNFVRRSLNVRLGDSSQTVSHSEEGQAVLSDPNPPESKIKDVELLTKKVKKDHAVIGRHMKKNLYGRHVCSKEQVISKPLKVVESFCKPVYKSFTQKCSDGICTAFRVQYETLYRTVMKTQTSVEKKQVCCPGWTHPESNPQTCTQAICELPCQNGATCAKPEVCMCAPGYIGHRCEKDVDECATASTHRCHHLCVNAPGSYTCACHDGFDLLEDGVNCRIKVDTIPEFLALRKSYEEIAEKIKNVDFLQKSSLHESTTAEAKSQTAHIQVDRGLKAEVERLGSVLDQISARLTKLERDMEDPSEDKLRSLSDQVGLLEEQLADCSCVNSGR